MDAVERVIKLLPQPFLVFQVRGRAGEWTLEGKNYSQFHAVSIFTNQYGMCAYPIHILLSCSLSAERPRMHTAKGLLQGTYLYGSEEFLYRCAQIKLDPD